MLLSWCQNYLLATRVSWNLRESDSSSFLHNSGRASHQINGSSMLDMNLVISIVLRAFQERTWRRFCFKLLFFDWNNLIFRFVYTSLHWSICPTPLFPQTLASPHSTTTVSLSHTTASHQHQIFGGLVCSLSLHCFTTLSSSNMR